ncbi:MAG: 7-cyano-7-deazaguanine synthase [Streptomyces sp.]|uniref:7-cyano-7-deazaguanine synthase n=1 Tax=Quadrisphaera sp. GCM10027208 TaxID=3273423 RepID=UPI0019C0FBA6|nr:7-cyano-7-deazaguanine synthase [Streptomyces sp.]
MDFAQDTLVMLSGGMESVTALHYVKHHSAARVAAIFVNLGQDSAIRQLARAKEHCNLLGVHLEVLNLPDVRNLFLDVVEPPYNLVAEGPRGLSPEIFGCYDSVGATVMSALYAANHGYTQTIYGATASDRDRAPEIERMLSGTEDIVRASWGRGTTMIAPFLQMTDEEVAALALAERVDISRTWSCHYGGIEHCGSCERCLKRQRVFGVLDAKTIAGFGVTVP